MDDGSTTSTWIQLAASGLQVASAFMGAMMLLSGPVKLDLNTWNKRKDSDDAVPDGATQQMYY
jgi:hypothetical protein